MHSDEISEILHYFLSISIIYGDDDVNYGDDEEFERVDNDDNEEFERVDVAIVILPRYYQVLLLSF